MVRYLLFRALSIALVATVFSQSTLAFAQEKPKEVSPKEAVLKADLWLAILEGDLSKVKIAIAKGADPNGRNWLEFTPLMFAASRGNQIIITGRLFHQALNKIKVAIDGIDHGTPHDILYPHANFVVQHIRIRYQNDLAGTRGAGEMD